MGVEHWKIVTSKENSADHLSRDLKVDTLLSLQRWTQGLDFLWNPNSDRQIQPPAISIPSDDPEVKVSVNTTRKSKESPVEIFMSYISSWLKLNKTVAWMMVAKRCLNTWVAKRKVRELKLS